MSELESRFVHRGYWVNEAAGPIMGQTITTDSRTGALIIALLAVLTSIGLTHFWHLLTYFYHQARTDGKDSDGLFRQQQALLRTLPSPSTLMADSIKIWFAWRDVGDRALMRSLFLAIFALLFVAASLAGSIFSSYVASSFMIEVLVKSPFCGLYSGDIFSDRSYLAAITSAAQNYAPDCQGSGDLPSRCHSIFVHPNVPFTTEHVDCPFNQSICATRAIALDSGLVDLNDAFGINARDSDRVLFRRRTTCSVLSLEGRTSVANASDIPFTLLSGREAMPNEKVNQYYYGQFKDDDPNTPSFYYSFIAGNTTRTMSTVNIISHAEIPLHNKFIMIPELQRQDADVSLRLTCGNGIRFDTPVNDPMFMAHRQVIFENNQGVNETYYNMDAPGTIMGCAEQYQYCVKTGKGNSCTGLRGVIAGDQPEILPEANPFQLALMKVLTFMPDGFYIASPGRYDAQTKYSQADAIPSLPDDQWIQELQTWEAIVWAAYQIVISDHAIGPTVRNEKYFIPPDNDGEKALCHAQKMRKQGGFMNINYFALVFIIAVSCTIAIIDLILFKSLTLLFSFRKKPTPRLDRWVQDGVFQLLRRAHEAHGGGTWKDLDKEVPVTVEKTKLPDLPIDSLPHTSCPVCQHSSFTVADTEEQELKLETNEEPESGQENPGSTSIPGTGEDELISPLSSGELDNPKEQPANHVENINEPQMKPGANGTNK